MRDPDETELDPVEVLTEAEAWAPDAQEGISPQQAGWEPPVSFNAEPQGPTATLGEDGLELDPNQAPE
jgi:hypothetical protein